MRRLREEAEAEEQRRLFEEAEAMAKGIAEALKAEEAEAEKQILHARQRRAEEEARARVCDIITRLGNEHVCPRGLGIIVILYRKKRRNAKRRSESRLNKRSWPRKTRPHVRLLKHQTL